MEFIKMHGLGNDFIVVDLMKKKPDFEPAETAKRVCRRFFSVGADGLVLVLPSDKGDARMRIFNPDGSEPEMCGNAIRCVAKYLRETGYIAADKMSIETLAGMMEISVVREGNTVVKVSVDMGAPEDIGSAEIPVGDAPAVFYRVSTSNPHAVTYSVFPDDKTFFTSGPQIEKSPIFPEGTNVEFCRVESRSHIRVRVWERGAGPTLACGTGATASFFAGVKAGHLDKRATVTLPGGDLEFELLDNGHVIMTGPAEEAFRGTL